MSTEAEAATNIGVIVLAAGASKRLGRPKQLLLHKGKTLLQHTVETALAANAGPVVVVLGASADTIQNEITDRNVQVVINAEWKDGMASSIRYGVKALTEINSAIEGIILMVCDQPYVTPPLLNRLIEAYKKTAKPVIACSYEATFGPPVFFHHSLFAKLLLLNGDIGARGVVKQHADTLELIPFPDGSFDVDTEKDYERLDGESKQGRK